LTGRTRQERALRRREALLDAAVTLLTEGGFAAVTHRAVAQRAGIPLAATTYYFSSRDQLLAHSFDLLVQRELGHMRAWLDQTPAASPERLADALITTYDADRNRRLGVWELYLQAGRDPGLRDIARAWTDGTDEIIADGLRRAGAPHGRAAVRFVTTLLSGLSLEHVVEARPESRERAREVLAHALTALQVATPDQPDIRI
jgi:DNA-binding transcriptional regulator YbjK